jgi:methylthioribose-1-phosphate isomerase
VNDARDPIPRTVAWDDGRVRLIDQRALPASLEFLSCGSVDEVCDAITSLAVRGAPALATTCGRRRRSWSRRDRRR